MPTIRLIPSTYYLSNSSYLSVSNAANMYANTDSTNYATVTNSRTSTSSYYIYIRGFNFDDVPTAAVVNDITIRLKAYHSGGNTSTIYCYDGTTQVSAAGSTTALTTSATVKTFSNTTVSWETLKGYGSDFGIRINCRRSSRNTTSHIYIYGAEIEIDYTLPVSATVTSTLTGNGTIDPSGAYSTYEGEEYGLTITPTNKSDQVTATKDGVDITSELVAHGTGSTISATADDYTTSGIQSGSSYASYCIGYSAENPSTSGTSSNMYSSSGSTGHVDYTFDFSDIPSNATIEEVSVRCYGHRENATIDSSHVSNVALYSGTTQKGDDVDFPSTSNSTITIDNPGSWTRTELDSAVLRHTVGYYGGLVLGITFEVTYSTGTGVDHYTYTYTVTGDATIAVVIGGSTQKLYFKNGSTWSEVVTAYKKVNGSWVVQSDVTNVFQPSVNYKKG